MSIPTLFSRTGGGLQLMCIPKDDYRLRRDAENHYSQPKGFVGRSLCYAVLHDGNYFGSIVAGSATKHLPGRSEFFGADFTLERVINNVFFHIERPYPIRNFAIKVLALWRTTAAADWGRIYGDRVIGFESLIQLPRTGETYKRDGWTLVGQTKGYTCKRGPGQGSDSWTGKRVWNTTDLVPKLVFCRRIDHGQT